MSAAGIGARWVGLTTPFEFGFGHCVARKSWSTLIADYDLRRGPLWPLVVAGNRTGFFDRHTFDNPGCGPGVAASGISGAVECVFTTWSAGTNRVLLAGTACSDARLAE
jgi:hypothetical protein